MLSSFNSAAYDSVTGNVVVNLDTSTAPGYPNQIIQMDTPNIISVPKSGEMINIEQQDKSQVLAVGYANRIIDSNFSIGANEIALYSANWYGCTYGNGVFVQEANTTHKENYMMGQSTNSVLHDILAYLIAIFNYLGTHTHSGVQSGTDTSGVPVTPPPVDTQIIDDQTYIDGNKNLAITGTYEPR